MARFLDDDQVATLADATHLSLTASPLDSAAMPGDVASAVTQLGGGTGIVTEALARKVREALDAFTTP